MAFTAYDEELGPWFIHFCLCLVGGACGRSFRAVSSRKGRMAPRETSGEAANRVGDRVGVRSGARLEIGAVSSRQVDDRDPWLEARGHGATIDGQSWMGADRGAWA